MAELAADDLGYALVAHTEYPSDISHGQPIFVCLTDCPVPITSEALSQSSEVRVAASVLLGKDCQAGTSLW
jgi:hypothetical protein